MTTLRGVGGVAWIVALFLAAVPVGCRRRPAEAPASSDAVILPAPGDRGRVVGLRRAWPVEPVNLLPFLDPPDGYSQMIGRYLYEGLVALDGQTGRPIPAVASKIDVSVDGKTVTAVLRPGVLFHDGTPLTTADVLATFAAVRNPANPTATLRASLADLATIRSPAAGVVEMIWKAPYYRAVRVLADLAIVPERVARAGLATEEARRRAPGTGPFRLREWHSGQSIRLARHERHWGTPPRLSEVTIKFIREPSTQLAAFRRGELDLVSVTPAAFAAERDALSRDPRWRVYRYDRTRYDVVHLNVRRPPLDDVRVRRAIERAVDRPAMARAFFDGLYPPIEGPVMPVGDGFVGFEAPARPADPAGARALLADAKVTLAAPLILRSFAGSAETRQIAESLRAQLAAVGLPMTVRESDWPTLAADLDAGRFDLVLVQEQASPDVLAFDAAGGAAHPGGYARPEVAALIARARRAVDDGARGELVRQAARLVAEDAPSLYLWRYAVVTLARTELRGLMPSPLIGLDDMRAWTLRPHEVRP